MKNVILLFLIPAVFICITPGCEILDISDKAEKNLIYPLEEGNVWEYEREFAVFNLRSVVNPDSVIESGEVFISAASTVRSNGIVNRTEFSNVSGAVIELEQTYVEDGRLPEFKSWNYYTYKDDGLYLLGYRSASGALAMPKVRADENISGTGIYFVFDGRYFNSVRRLSEYIEFMVQVQYGDPDDMIVEDNPLKIIPRHMNTGSQWTYRTKGNPWRIDRRILGREVVDVPAGQFECYKVQWLIDHNDSGEWDENLILYDYIAENGLIKREFYYSDHAWVSFENPIDEGYFDSHDISVLTGYEMK